MYALKPTEPEKNGKALPKLWEIGSALTELEGIISDILDAEDLTEAEKDVRAAYALNEWLQAGANFDEKAAHVAGFIRHAKLSVRKKQPKLILHCAPEELPEQFVRITCEPCLTEIRKVLKESELPWASLSSEVEFSLQIR